MTASYGTRAKAAHLVFDDKCSTKAEFSDEIQSKKVFRVFLLAIESHLYSFLFLQAHATSYSFSDALLYTVKEKGGKPGRKQHPLSQWFKKSIQKPQV
jgi:hypothetical protein